jgi:hypothetical protein
MRGILRGLAIVGIVLVGSMVLVIAQHIAAERGMAFGALPSILIAVPFLYVASKLLVPRGKNGSLLTDAQNLERLEAIASNPKVSEPMREEARRRADKLRSVVGG